MLRIDTSKSKIFNKIICNTLALIIHWLSSSLDLSTERSCEQQKPRLAALGGAGDGEPQSWHTLGSFPQNQPFSTLTAIFSTACGKKCLDSADLWSACSNWWRTDDLDSSIRPILRWAGWWGSFQWTLPPTEGIFNHNRRQMSSIHWIWT